jgi:hypothetical protein
MKIAPTPLLEKKRAAAAEPPIHIVRVKRETKVAANDLVKFELKVHPDDEESTLKYTKTVHRLSADSTPEETLLWSRDLKSVLENQRTTTADGKIATLSRIVREDLWPVAEASFAAANATEAQKNRGYTAAVNALVTKIFPTKSLNKQKSYMHRQLRKPVDMKVRLYIERVQLLNTYLKEFPPFNNNQSLPDDAVVEIAYHGLPRTWKDFLLMQGFDEQDGTIANLLDISQRIETMEEWSETTKTHAGKRTRSVSEKTDKSPNKKQRSDFYCEYHGPNKSHGTKDCTKCKSILQSARNSRDEKHGSEKPAAKPKAGSDYAKRVAFKKPWNNQSKDEAMQTIFNTAFHKAAVKYMTKHGPKNDTVPTQEFNNLNLEEGDASSDSDSSSSEEE